MNKKRLGKFIAVSSVFVLSSVTGVIIAGCDGCSKHEHNLTEVTAVAPTCTTDGRSAYYVCDGCEMIFSDAEGKTEIAVEDTVVGKLGHDLEHHAADPATCLKPGNIEYWECSRGDGLFSDAEGKNPVENVETTKEHTWGETGHHAQVDPTTESEGTKEYWHCSECNLDYADEFGDRQVTIDELKIDKVSENIDGYLTENFYPTNNALIIGGADVQDGGKGIIINAVRANDGVYLHIVANYDVEATQQPTGKGKIGLYFNVRNSENLNLPGGAGVCLDQAMLMELYLTGKVDYHKPYFLMDFETTKNGEGANTKYTSTWEMFIPHSGFATVNDGAFAEAFETVEGKTTLKTGYTYMVTAIGAFAPSETFVNNGNSQCSLKDDNTWAFWVTDGHGDWGTDQKYYVLGAQGITSEFQRATDTYTVVYNNYTNASVTGRTDTVDYDNSLQGTVTVDDGYRLSGIKVNGQVFKFEKAVDANTYDYEIAVSDLTNLKWNETVLTVEVVITKLDYETVEVTLLGKAGGETNNIAQGTYVTLVSEFDDSYEVQVGADGKAQFENVLCIDYSIIINDYINGHFAVVKGEQTAEAILEYHFAHNAGTRPDLVDLTDMNAQNASITLGAQDVNGVDQNVIAAQLNLSDEMKNAEAYVLYTTVTVNGDISTSKPNTWLQRFGIRFAVGDAGNYNNKFVIWWDDLGLNQTPSAIWANDLTSCGGGADRAATYRWLQSSLMDGLKLKVVRNGGYVSVSALNLDDGEWYTLLSGTTSASAKNDITFFVSGESFTFSEISYEELEVSELILPVGNEDGVKGYLTASNGDVFTLGGILTSLDELAIPADSIAYTDYDNINIESEVITIFGNGIDDRESHSSNYATYILPESVRGEKEISLTFNIKDINEYQGTDAWAARRFGIQIGEGAYGVYFWTMDTENFNLNRFVVGTLDMNTDKDGQEIVKVNWAATMIRSANGLDVQIVRIGNKLIVNFKNADGAWVKVGETDCPATAETDIKFVGGGDTWEVSSIAAGKLQKVEADEATLEKAGNIAHYTDGVNYYLLDGTVTTEKAVIIPQIVEKEVEITVEVYGTDGSKVEADLSNVKVTLTGEYDYNKNIYTELSITGGVLTLEDGKIYEGTYSVTVNGYAVDAIEIDDNTSALTLKLYQISSYQITDVTKTYKPESVNVGFNTNGVTVKLIGAKGVNYWDEIWTEYDCPVPEATLTLPAEIANNKNISLEFNLKLSNQGFWGANAFGVSVVKGYSGFILRTMGDNVSDTTVCELYAQKLCENDMKTLGENAWLKNIALSASGLNMRVLRNGTTITLYAQNTEGEWLKLYQISCSEDSETEIKFMGAALDVEVSNIVVCTAPAAFVTPDGSIKVSENIVYHKYVAPTIEDDGCNAYYSVGETLYTESGEKTTLEDLKIAKLTPTEITLTVKGHKDGEEIQLNGTITATGEYETEFSGTLEDGQATVNAYVVTYTVSVDGYISKSFTVVAGTTEYALVLEYEYATKTYAPEKVDLSGMNNANHEIKLTGDKGANYWDAIWTEYDCPVPEATLTLPAEIANSKSVSLEFNLKLYNEGFWGSNAFGVSIVKGYGGFILRTMGDNVSDTDVCELYAQKLAEDNVKKLGVNTWLKDIARSEDGLNVRVVRSGTVIVLYAQNEEGEWVDLYRISCSADLETEIKFMGAAADFTVSQIKVSEYTPKTITADTNEIPDDVNLTVNELKEGYALTGTVSSDNYSEFSILVNSKSIAVVNSGEFSIAWSALGITDETQITVSVYVTETKAETASAQACPTGNTNLDGETLDGNKILGYARYNNSDLGGNKYSGDVVGNEVDGHSRFGDDYDGTREGTTFTADGVTNGGCAYFDPGQYYNVTLHISKETTKIRIYTGTYQTGKLEYVLSESGIVLADASFDKSEGRAYIVEIEIDTSLWADDETRDLTLRVGGVVDCELAAIVVLGEAVAAE